MLREIQGLAEEPRTRRRWFHDDYFDLFVWQTSEGEITGFQLCYGIDASERALVWNKQGGFFHDGVSAGERGKGEVLGQQIQPGAPLAEDPVLRRFESVANALPEDVRKVVADRLRAYAEKRSSAPARRKRFRRAPWQKPAAASRAGAG